MLNKTASLDLVEFIETQILPQYANFDKAHNLEHVTRVIRRSMELMMWACRDPGPCIISLAEKFWPATHD